MTLKGVDIAWSRPTTASIKATGAKFVARYLSPDSTKNITAAEVKDYAVNGLGVVVVWEASAQRMLGGYAAGQADARSAEIQRAAVGLPNTMPIYFACDFDVQGTQYHTINEYMRGVNDVIGVGRSGFYGGYYAVNNVAAAPARATYFWQTVAWSAGHVSSHANIYQPGGTTLSGGADWDTAETADYGQYPRPSAPKPPEDELPTPKDVWSYQNTATGDPTDMHGLLSEIYKAVVAQTIVSQVDGSKHSLDEHEAATNKAAFDVRDDVASLKKDVASIKAALAAIAKKVGA